MARASDDTREQAVAVLRRGLVTGRLGTDTFVARVDAAYQAKTHDELASVTGDLPARRRILSTLREWFASGTYAVPAADPIRLQPPDMATGDRRVLGRDAWCDYTIADRAVSSRHAELVRLDDGWMIKDLDSRNGTRVNGWLVSEQRLQAGDSLMLGETLFVFSP